MTVKANGASGGMAALPQQSDGRSVRRFIEHSAMDPQLVAVLCAQKVLVLRKLCQQT